MRSRRGAVPALVLALAIAVPLAGAGAQPAAADEATAAEVHELAERAQTDPAALDRLRAVDTVDGQPVDLATALDASGETLARRLAALAASAGDEAQAPPERAAAADAEAAQDILAGRRYNPVEPPRPFRGALRRIGDWLEPVGEPIGRLMNRLADNTLLMIMVAAVMIGAAAVVAKRLIARRIGAATDAPRRSAPGDADDPDLLDQRATDAERRGDLDTAYRLRFRAGLIRLGRAGAIEYRPSLTTGQLEALLPIDAFVAVGDAHDEIAYGGRPASADDVERARDAWPRILAEARR